MAFSQETGGAWSVMEDVLLCECWIQISHDPISGNEMKFSQMWKKILHEFVERSGSTRTESALSSQWKLLNKELGKWRDALTKAMNNHASGENLSDEIVQAQMFYGATGLGKKSFTHTQCWEVVKHCKRFSIIPIAPTVVLNETPLHDSQASDSPMESPMSEDLPIQKEPRPMGRKAAKAKRGVNSTSNTSKFLEEIARQSALRIEIDKKVQEDDRAMAIEFAKEREYVRKEREYRRKENEERKDRETMAMDTSHMSPETKQYWKLERKAIMRRKLFRDDGPSNTDWLNDENP
ncbi:unnamed protein product [Prunus armeniaca]